MKKLLILYTSVGEGHKKIAENLGVLLENDYETDLCDVLRLEKGTLVDSGTGLYLWILKHTPWLWNFFYTNKLFLTLTLPLRVPVAGRKSKKILELIRSKNYDIVLTTQVNPSAVVSYLKKKKLFRGKFIIAFSDYHLHPYWVFKNADLFLANIKEQKEQMISMGVTSSKIAVCGMTLKPLSVLDTQPIKNKFNLLPGEKTVLFLGGSLGIYISSDEIEVIRGENIKIIIVCGKNSVLREILKNKFQNCADIVVLGYVKDMEELYAIADLVVSKPGGLTVAECIRRGLPMQINAYMPGQEKLNYEYLIRKRLVMPLVPDLPSKIAGELRTWDFKMQLGNNPAVKEILKNGTEIKSALRNCETV